MLRIRTPSELGRRAEAKMRKWKAQKRKEAVEPKETPVRPFKQAKKETVKPKFQGFPPLITMQFIAENMQFIAENMSENNLMEDEKIESILREKYPRAAAELERRGLTKKFAGSVKAALRHCVIGGTENNFEQQILDFLAKIK